MGTWPHIEITGIERPAESLLVCEDCGESFAGADDVSAAADWVEKHIAERHRPPR